MKKWSFRIWEIAYPIGLYYVVVSFAIVCARIFLGQEEENYMLCQIIASLAAIPVVLTNYKQVPKVVSEKKDIKSPVIAVVVMILFAISLNNLILMSPLVSISQGYEEASNAFYGSGNLWVELLGSALLIPIVEELLYRGIVYRRLRFYSKPWVAVLGSAVIFGLVHFNIVQFVYAGLLGIALAIFLEKSDNILVPILGHIAANAIAVIRTETGWLSHTTERTIPAVTFSVVILLLGIFVLVWYGKEKHEKNSIL